MSAGGVCNGDEGFEKLGGAINNTWWQRWFGIANPVAIDNGPGGDSLSEWFGLGFVNATAI